MEWRASGIPAPVSIWICEASGAVLNIKIDLTAAEDSFGKEVAADTTAVAANIPFAVTECYTEYRNFVVNNLKTLEMPK